MAQSRESRALRLPLASINTNRLPAKAPHTQRGRSCIEAAMAQQQTRPSGKARPLRFIGVTRPPAEASENGVASACRVCSKPIKAIMISRLVGTMAVRVFFQCTDERRQQASMPSNRMAALMLRSLAFQPAPVLTSRKHIQATVENSSSKNQIMDLGCSLSIIQARMNPAVNA